MIILLDRFPKIVAEAGERYEPSMITRHIIDIAQCFNKYYYNYRILGEAPEVTAARLELTEATATVIKKGLTLLGIKTVEKM